ncbi:hypothetical protein [Streptomyces sp. NBC_01750]|uniref:hypothetical protein n=1 Tax=Streptomyces sp. NBC_01750 TaxID=2975928 RepID=UPI002DDA1D2F|nr:hypothetical protein [Streptomyces sp. NBC_01750]WSD37504.1 hypothetical protein OG966_39840 [Streptomyces sp. NBC_01750]
MPKLRRVLTAATVGIAGVAGSIAIAPAANAATSLCGSGYAYVGKHAMTRDSGTGGPRTGGYVYVYYSKQTRHNCAIAKPVPELRSTARKIGVGLYSPAYKRGHSDGYNSWENYRKWAGPVYVKAPHSCITVVGDVSAGRAHYSVNKRGVHCG